MAGKRLLVQETNVALALLLAVNLNYCTLSFFEPSLSVDGVIVTSKFTGIEPNTDDLKKVKCMTNLPVLIGSGMTSENISTFFDLADYFIVGSDFRTDGKFLAEMEYDRLERFVNKFHNLKTKNQA
ncbi:hypothetical protein IT415_00620 [bacterium]|nr:hypothetical protein [bacterium]